MVDKSTPTFELKPFCLCIAKGGKTRVLNNAMSMSIRRLTPIDIKPLSNDFSLKLNKLGEASGVAQELKLAITTAEKLSSDVAIKEKHVLYALVDKGSNLPVGFVKIGRKHLYLLDENNKLVEKDPLCVLDFYIDEGVQRKGYGKMVFDGMCGGEKVVPGELAYDRPSRKMFPFLDKNYGLSGFIEQSNKFVVFDEFW